MLLCYIDHKRKQRKKISKKEMEQKKRNNEANFSESSSNINESLFKVPKSFNSNDNYSELSRDIKQSNEYNITAIAAFHHNTFWHKILHPRRADKILYFTQSKCACLVIFIVLVLYFFALYTFDTDLFGNFAPVFCIFAIIPTLIISVVYFGTINVQIGQSILLSFTFWFKMCVYLFEYIRYNIIYV